MGSVCEEVIDKSMAPAVAVKNKIVRVNPIEVKMTTQEPLENAGSGTWSRVSYLR